MTDVSAVDPPVGVVKLSLSRSGSSAAESNELGKDGKPTRVGFKIQADGKKVRIAKRSGAEIDG